LKRGIVDRFEGDYAIIELDKGFERIAKGKLPTTVKEGDVIVIDKEKIYVDIEETNKRKNKIKGLFDKLFQ